MAEDFEGGRETGRETGCGAECETGRGADRETELIYDPRDGGVGVSVVFGRDGHADLRVSAPAELVSLTLADANAALARRCGVRADDPAQLDMGELQALQAQMGEEQGSSFLAAFVLARLFSLAMMRIGVMPFGEPDYVMADLPRAGQPYDFKARVLVRPAFELADYDAPVRLGEAPVATEGQVDAWIENMARNLAAQSAGGTAPLIDDAWVCANMPEAGDLSGLRAKVRAVLERPLRAQARRACAAELAGRLVGEVDEALVDARLEDLRGQAVERLARQGATLEEYLAQEGLTLERWLEGRRQAAREDLRAEFALDALADHLGLQVDEDAIAWAMRSASPELTEQQQDDLAWFAESGQTHRLCEFTLRRLAQEWLLEHAEVGEDA